LQCEATWFKNEQHLFSLFALVNLYMARRMILAR